MKNFIEVAKTEDEQVHTRAANCPKDRTREANV